MIEIFLVFGVFTLSLLLTWSVIRNSPREKIFKLYSQKRQLAKRAFDNNDLEMYHYYSRDASELGDMMLRLDRDECFRIRDKF